jgi:hypothetical protein
MAILMSAVFAIAMLCVATITKVGGHLIDLQRAQHTANAVALVAIYDKQFVDSLASQNGGELVELDDNLEISGTFSALVCVGRATRSATAFDTWHDTTPTLEP